MAKKYWLAKQEPAGPRGYSFDCLKKDKRTVWDGIHNNLALKHMRGVAKGDQILYYHTGSERQAVGIMEAASGPYPNPEEDSERFIAIDVRHVRALARPVTLAEMRACRPLAGWELLTNSRLSFMPVPAGAWKAVLAMSRA